MVVVVDTARAGRDNVVVLWGSWHDFDDFADFADFAAGSSDDGYAEKKHEMTE